MSDETKETPHPDIPWPVCPYCGERMEPFKYRGYYDAFYYWGCMCDPIPNATIHKGSYA